MAKSIHAHLADASEARWDAIHARFWNNVVVLGEQQCWLWPLSKNNCGYGHCRISKRDWLTHRIAYELTYGPIPEGLHIDHLCNERLCCNPRHLEAVDPLENLSRGHAWAGRRREHCRRGHLYAPEGVYLTETGRGCRTCRAERQRAARQRRVAS